MHPRPRAALHQQKRIRHHARSLDSHGFLNLLTAPDMPDSVESLLPEHRERLFPPTETLSMFLAQAMSADRSCQKAVNDAAIQRLACGLKSCSTHTGAYCRARQRFSCTRDGWCQQQVHMIGHEAPAMHAHIQTARIRIKQMQVFQIASVIEAYDVAVDTSLHYMV